MKILRYYLTKEEEESRACGRVMLDKVQEYLDLARSEFENRLVLDPVFSQRCGPLPAEYGRCAICFLNPRTMLANFDHWVQKHIVEDRNWRDMPEMVKEKDEPSPIYCPASGPKPMDNRWALGEPPQIVFNTPLMNPGCYTKFFWFPRLETTELKKLSGVTVFWYQEDEERARAVAPRPGGYDTSIRRRQTSLDRATRQLPGGNEQDGAGAWDTCPFLPDNEEKEEGGDDGAEVSVPAELKQSFNTPPRREQVREKRKQKKKKKKKSNNK